MAKTTYLSDGIELDGTIRVTDTGNLAEALASNFTVLEHRDDLGQNSDVGGSLNDAGRGKRVRAMLASLRDRRPTCMHHRASHCCLYRVGRSGK